MKLNYLVSLFIMHLYVFSLTCVFLKISLALSLNNVLISQTTLSRQTFCQTRLIYSRVTHGIYFVQNSENFRISTFSSLLKIVLCSISPRNFNASLQVFSQEFHCITVNPLHA